MSRWDVEAKTIPAYLLRQGNALNKNERHDLMLRRAILKRAVLELRDAMANMAARYRGVIDGDVVVEAATEDEVWAVVRGQGVVEFCLMTEWAETDRSVDHRSHDLDKG